MSRERLPARRPNQTTALVYDGTRYEVTVGFHPATGEAREVFCHGAKAGSNMDAILDDACILLSVLLQHGVAPASLVATMGRLGGVGQCASIIGALAEHLARASA